MHPHKPLYLNQRKRLSCDSVHVWKKTENWFLYASKILEGLFLPASVRALEVGLGDSRKDFQGETDPCRQTELSFGQDLLV